MEKEEEVGRGGEAAASSMQSCVSSIQHSIKCWLLARLEGCWYVVKCMQRLTSLINFPVISQNYLCNVCCTVGSWGSQSRHLPGSSNKHPMVAEIKATHDHTLQ